LTAADRSAGKGAGSPRSLRQAQPGNRGPLAALGVLLIASEIVGGWRVLGPGWQGGDLLYHSALANAIVHGQLAPGGPYAGMPTYYPPGFHLMAAAVMTVLGLDFARADQLLTLVWLPLLPLGTFLLVRRLTGRPWVALLAATLTVFGGAYDLSAGRLWVNSLFMAGHEAYPIYPRDVVFALLPFAFLAFIEALEAPRARAAGAWTLAAGILLGVSALVQVQLLLPIPFALATVALAVAVRRPDRRWRAPAVFVLTGALAVAITAPWLLGQLEAIRANGGVSLESSDQLTAARFGPWSYPREFGLLLPFGIVGSGVALLFLRRGDGPRPDGRSPGPWRPRPVEAPLGLVVWFGLAFVLGVFYQSTWPLRDALQPQRLWLLSGQPMTMLAAIGLVAATEDLIGRLRPVRLAPRTAIAGLLVGAMVVACVPTTAATARLLSETWTSPTYAHLDLRSDRVPSFASLLPADGPRETVLTYEDWSSLAWFQTGQQVVGLLPPGFAKLAYDPAIFTGVGQEERRRLLLSAFDGDPADLAAGAASRDARWIVLGRRGDALGLFDAAAVPVTAAPGLRSDAATPVSGNGWDAVALGARSWLDMPVRATGRTDLEIRVLGSPVPGSVPERRFIVRVLGPSGTERAANSIAAPAARDDPWQVVHAQLELQAGDRLRIEAVDPITVQSARGFLPTSEPLASGSRPVPGWRVTTMTADAVVLELAQ
jgi:hypothetical protein